MPPCQGQVTKSVIRMFTITFLTTEYCHFWMVIPLIAQYVRQIGLVVVFYTLFWFILISSLQADGDWYFCNRQALQLAAGSRNGSSSSNK